MKLKVKLKQIKQKKAEHKAAQLQKRTKKIAHQLYLQRLNTQQSGDEASDWAKAERIVKDPIKQSLYKLKGAFPIRWGLSGWDGKTPWQWLELLIVPFFLAMGAFYLENRVEQRQERIAADRYKQEARIADERAKQDVLDNYLDKMQGLLLDRGLRESFEKSEVRSVARAITTTAMKELGAERNSLLIDFLREANLLGSADTVSSTSFSATFDKDARQKIAQAKTEAEATALLPGLDLSGINLRNAALNDAYIIGINLSSANLSGANLNKANLSRAELFRVNLSGARLFRTNLSRTNLNRANLSNAVLYMADLTDANLSNTDLSGTRFFSDFGSTPTTFARIINGVNLSGTDFSNANLSTARISEEQLNNSLLCKTQLPVGFTVNPDRDCEKLK